VAPAPGYLSQVCHGDLTYPEFIKFDNELWKLWRTILGGVGGTEQLKLCNLGHTRARGWAYLPASCSGAGLSSWSAISKYSWFCSMAECSTQYDVDFECSRAFRRADCESAHLVALTELGGPTYVNRADLQFLPPEQTDVLVESNFYSSGTLITNTLKYQKSFLNSSASNTSRNSPVKTSSTLNT